MFDLDNISDDNDDDNVEYTVEVVQMSHYCPVSGADDHMTRWDAEQRVYETGWAEETTQCPACGSWELFFPSRY
jgi:RNA polymerase subunit RPABC4/transcription elongation factor Spt4